MREEILKLLERDGKLSAAEIAVMLSLSEAAVAEEIKAMEKENIIGGYKAVINWDNTDRVVVEALIEIRVVPKPDFGFDDIAKKIMDTFKLTPRGIIESLNLRQPIYKQTTNYGHFGKKELPWEKVIKMV